MRGEVQGDRPTFSLGLQDGLAVREMIARSPGLAATPRAYAKIIVDINALELTDLRRPRN
jgi:hypothetical protein